MSEHHRTECEKCGVVSVGLCQVCDNRRDIAQIRDLLTAHLPEPEIAPEQDPPLGLDPALFDVPEDVAPEPPGEGDRSRGTAMEGYLVEDAPRWLEEHEEKRGPRCACIACVFARGIARLREENERLTENHASTMRQLGFPTGPTISAEHLEAMGDEFDRRRQEILDQDTVIAALRAKLAEAERERDAARAASGGWMCDEHKTMTLKVECYVCRAEAAEKARDEAVAALRAVAGECAAAIRALAGEG